MFLIYRFLLIFMMTATLFLNGCKKDDEDDDSVEQIVLPPCDDSIALDDEDAMNGVKALDICKTTTLQEEEWGVLEAQYIRANGTPVTHFAQIGIMGAFGSEVTPQRGERLLVLSTGRARTLTQPSTCGTSGCQMSGAGIAPTGFPQAVPDCPEPATTIYDDIGLEITLRAPKTAKGFSVDFIYYTFEYPIFVCSAYNDQFIILMNPAPAGTVNGNIALGTQNAPITVNSEFISEDNDNLLAGTGFGLWGSAACTGWLRTSAPVESGQEFTLRFIIYDTGDTQIDATVVLDNFHWLTDTTVTGTRKLL